MPFEPRRRHDMRPLLMRPTVLLLLPILAAVFVGCQPPPPKYHEVAAVNKEGGKAGEDNRAFLGSLSCSNRGCHASLDQSSATEKPLTCSFSLWNDQDPHAHAWAVLSDPSTKGPHMDRLLYPDGKKGAVWKDPRCLACHVTPQATFDWDPKV